MKLNIGFSGEGNALLNCKHFDRNNLQKSILNALENHLEYVYELETWATFMEKL